MLNLTINDKPPITSQQACQLVKRHTDRFGVFFDLDKCVSAHIDAHYEMCQLLPKLRPYCGSPDTRANVIEAFQKLQIPSWLYTNSKGGITIDQGARESIIASPEVSDEAREVVKLIDNYLTLKTLRSEATKYVSLDKVCARSYEGNRMTVGHPDWRPLVTHRLTTSEPNIQGVSRQLKSALTVPEGFIMVDSDSGQIEPRICYSAVVDIPMIKYLISLYGDAYYGILHYLLMDPADMENFNVTKMEITDALKASRNEIKVLALSVLYGSQLQSVKDQSLAKAALHRIAGHPVYLDLKNRVTDYVDSGGSTFYGLMGTPINPIDESNLTPKQKAMSTHELRSYLIRCGINNPIQCTASELLLHSVAATESLLQNTNSHMLGYVHDAGRFAIHETDAARILPELKGMLSYNVEGWLPIDSDFNVYIKGVKSDAY